MTAAFPLAPKKVGRPKGTTKIQPTEETMKSLRGLGQIQCTTKEGAAWFAVSEPTFLKFLADNPDARKAFDEGKQVGLTSLRRTQFRLAEKNAAMAIFLGKNYLGQSDKQELQHTGKDGGPIQYVDLTTVSDDDLKRLEHVLGALAHPGAGGSPAGTDQDGTGETEG